MATLRTATILLDALPSAGADGLIELVVCVTGEWVRGSHKFSITREDLRTIADNFKKRKNGAIVLDYEHASEMPEVAKGGPVPAAGWIRQVSANGSLRARAELTPRAVELIKNGEYRYISPALDFGAQDKETGEPQGLTLTSVALTNRPFIEELPAIRLSEINRRERLTVMTATEAQIELCALGHRRERERSIPFGEALRQVAREHPELALKSRE